MAIDTVVQFADDQLTKAKDALTTAGDAFATASAAAQVAAAKVAEIGTLLAAAEKKGRELQAAPRPTAAAARDLADQQALNEVTVHSLTARLSAARETAAVADALQTEAQSAAARAQARLDERQRLKQSADAAAKDWEVTERAVQAVRDLPVSIPDAVDAIKTGPGNSYAPAEARVNSEVPQKLRVEGRDRADKARLKIKKAVEDEQDAIKAVATKNRAHRGKSGDVAPARLVFAVNQRLVRDIAGAAAELEQIKARLDAINNAPPLPAGAVASITDLETAGKKAIVDLPGLATKIEEAATKVTEHKQKILDTQAEIAVQPPPANLPQLQADLAQLEADLPDLEDKLVEAEDDHREATMDLDLWEAAVPDAAWQRLLAFDDITRRLAELKTKFTPAKIDNLRNELIQAEKDLVRALEAEAAANREIETAELAAERQHNLAAAARELYDMNLLAAIRGDA